MNLRTLVVVLLAAVAAQAQAQSQPCNQGAPGHQGPWGVYVAPAPNTVYSKASSPFNITPAAVGAAICQQTVETLTGAGTGMPCALGTPPLDVNLSAACVAGPNQVTIRICNPTAAPITPAAGTYTTVVF